MNQSLLLLSSGSGAILRRKYLRTTHAIRPITKTPTMTPAAMAPLRAALPFEPPLPLEPPLPCVLVVFDGLRPNGQKSPPLGGSTQVRESPSLILTKFDEIDINDVVLESIMNLAGLGTVSDAEQFGPRAPMNDELPTKLFLCTLKFVAEVIAIP